jgi:decaprenyl-diphosphate synthase subunit 2
MMGFVAELIRWWHCFRGAKSNCFALNCWLCKFVSIVTRNLIYDGRSNMQAWGLIVLLVSKAAGHSPEIPDMDEDKSAGVLHSQRGLAEVTEMIRTSSLIHQGLVNLQTLANSGNELSADSEMIFGNKIALLGGDYLLGNACLQLAGLR